MIMLRVEHFNCSVMVHPHIWSMGKSTFYKCDMVFDTGASMTAIDTAVILRLGYSLKNADEVLVNGIGRSKIVAKRLTLLDFELGGVALGPILVDVLDFPEDSNILAVLGMNVIKHFKVTADFDHRDEDGSDGTIWLEPKFDIFAKPTLESFAKDSRFGDWWGGQKA